MAENVLGFKLEPVPDDPPAAAAASPGLNAAALSLFLLSLKTLGQRTLLAIDNLFVLFTVGLVFWIWASVPDPNTYQIVSHGIFALFVLAANVIVRRK